MLILLCAGMLWVWIALRMLSSSRSTSHDRLTHVELVPVKLGTRTGCTSVQGSRDHMEDTFQVSYDVLGDGAVQYFGVFDGHGGDKMSRFAALHLHTILAKQKDLKTDTANALINAFEELDARWLQLALATHDDDGSTGVVCVIVNGKIYCANTGDSRCVLGCANLRCVEMSIDHKPNRADEKERIEAANGKVLYVGTCWRVQGILAVSRSFGDRRLKRWVIATPEIRVREMTDEDHFLVLATDGLWDVLSSQQAVDIASRSVKAKPGGSDNKFATVAASVLVNHAFTKGSMDNITALVVDLRQR